MDVKDKLKGIYAITPPEFDETKLLNDINICLSCGVKIFQIRYKEEITIELKDFFSVLVKRIKKKEGITIINDFPQLAHDIGADGVHLGKADLSVDAVKNKYKNLFSFSKKYKSILDSKENAFFSVNAVARKPEKSDPETNPYLIKFMKQSVWQPKKLGVFAGKIDYPKYKFFDKHMIRFIMWITNGPTDINESFEFTDWSKVDDFAKDIFH